MRERKSSNYDPAPWHVPVVREDVTEAGRHFDLAANAEIRAAVARMTGLRDLPRLEASFDVTRHGAAGLRVAGRVSATAGQTCVVTLEPLTNEIEEEIDLVFEPPAPHRPAEHSAAKDEPLEARWDERESLIGGRVDLGVLATEFLVLGLDPYPRKPGALFQAPPDAAAEGKPFAALAALKKGRDAS